MRGWNRCSRMITLKKLGQEPILLIPWVIFRWSVPSSDQTAISVGHGAEFLGEYRDLVGTKYLCGINRKKAGFFKKGQQISLSCTFTGPSKLESITASIGAVTHSIDFKLANVSRSSDLIPRCGHLWPTVRNLLRSWISLTNFNPHSKRL